MLWIYAIVAMWNRVKPQKMKSDNSGLTKQGGLGMINPSVPMVNQGVRDSSQLMADDYARPEGQNILIE